MALYVCMSTLVIRASLAPTSTLTAAAGECLHVEGWSRTWTLIHSPSNG